MRIFLSKYLGTTSWLYQDLLFLENGYKICISQYPKMVLKYSIIFSFHFYICLTSTQHILELLTLKLHFVEDVSEFGNLFLLLSTPPYFGDFKIVFSICAALKPSMKFSYLDNKMCLVYVMKRILNVKSLTIRYAWSAPCHITRHTLCYFLSTLSIKSPILFVGQIHHLCYVMR